MRVVLNVVDGASNPSTLEVDKGGSLTKCGGLESLLDHCVKPCLKQYKTEARSPIVDSTLVSVSG